MRQTGIFAETDEPSAADVVRGGGAASLEQVLAGTAETTPPSPRRVSEKISIAATASAAAALPGGGPMPEHGGDAAGLAAERQRSAAEADADVDSGREDAGKRALLPPPPSVSPDLAAAPEVALNLPLPAMLDGSPPTRAPLPVGSGSTVLPKGPIRYTADATGKLYLVRLDDEKNRGAGGGKDGAGRVGAGKGSMEEDQQIDVRARNLCI